MCIIFYIENTRFTNNSDFQGLDGYTRFWKPWIQSVYFFLPLLVSFLFTCVFHKFCERWNPRTNALNFAKLPLYLNLDTQLCGLDFGVYHLIGGATMPIFFTICAIIICGYLCDKISPNLLIVRHYFDSILFLINQQELQVCVFATNIKVVSGIY